ncbi:MAG: hypothetical protein KatS3mg106_752 [Gemmataceae bacterium]|jgi:large subunit ribosomal protein L18|uniref:Large ribosomal subunit protein uL18 n=1 Tax=Thermogemmata fonticola TaxID=2755323 RepID=A0A7V8VCW7_9BACT|nr:50S ribosomal protein L18 [Thermogemmata fonticola]GIW84239.1 MAG: hypothetical protein KatS3mg106_752 [Gemmataceae bacterium]
MNTQKLKRIRAQRRKYRVRNRIYGTPQRPRLSVFRSNMHIYAQLIDDLHGVTLAAASSCGKNSGLSYGGNIAAAREVGRKIAELAKAKGITQAVFDRGSYRFHGRVAALAIAATEAGLKCTDPEAIRAKQEARAQKQAEAPKAKAEARPRGGPPAGKAPAKKEKAAK